MPAADSSKTGTSPENAIGIGRSLVDRAIKFRPDPDSCGNVVCGSSLTVSLNNISDLYGYQLAFNYDDSQVTPTINYDDTYFDTSVDASTLESCSAGYRRST